MRCGIFQPLALRNELIAVHKRGFISHSQAFSIKFLPSCENKMAFIVRKKLGKAHERNLVKRRFREIMKTLETQTMGIHCIIIAKSDAFEYPFNKLDHDTKKIFGKIFNQVATSAD